MLSLPRQCWQTVKSLPFCQRSMLISKFNYGNNNRRTFFSLLQRSQPNNQSSTRTPQLLPLAVLSIIPSRNMSKKVKAQQQQGGSKGKKGNKKNLKRNEDEESDNEEVIVVDYEKEQAEFFQGINNNKTKTIDKLKADFNKVRVGLVSPSFLDHVHVQIDGTPQALSYIAQVSVKGANALQVNVFDPSHLGHVEKALMTEPTLNIQRTTKSIVVTLPKLTKERRNQMTQETKGYLEHAKLSLRQLRTKGLEKIKKSWKSMGKDEKKRLEKQCEDIFTKANKEAENYFEAKKHTIEK